MRVKTIHPAAQWALAIGASLTLALPLDWFAAPGSLPRGTDDGGHPLCPWRGYDPLTTGRVRSGAGAHRLFDRPGYNRFSFDLDRSELALHGGRHSWSRCSQHARRVAAGAVRQPSGL